MSVSLFRLGGFRTSSFALPPARVYNPQPARLMATVSSTQSNRSVAPKSRCISHIPHTTSSFQPPKCSHMGFGEVAAAVAAALLLLTISDEEIPAITELRRRIEVNRDTITVISRGSAKRYWGIGRNLTEADIGKEVMRTGPRVVLSNGNYDWSFCREAHQVVSIDDTHIVLKGKHCTLTIRRNEYDDQNWMSVQEWDYFITNIEPTLTPARNIDHGYNPSSCHVRDMWI